MTQSRAAWPERRKTLAGRLHRSRWSVPHGLLTVLTLIAATAVALVPPGSYLLAQHARLAEALEMRALALAAELARHDRWLAAPEGDPSLQLVLRAVVGGTPQEGLWVLSPEGGLLAMAETDMPPAAPYLRRRAPIGGPTALLGELEVVHSLQPALRSAALLLLPFAALGTAIFLLLRQWPLRMLARALDRASYLSAHDPLTGLPNRDSLQRRLREAAQERQAITVLVLDLYRFRWVNEAFGHAAGDALLSAVAARLSGSLGVGDTLARLGGDTFAMIRAEGDPRQAAELAQDLLASLAPPFDLGGPSVEVSARIGIALGGESGTAGLLEQAELALQQAKQDGPSAFRFFLPEMQQRLRERRSLEQDLRRAMAEGQFRLAYQPLVCLASGRILGAEALLRWNRPGHGNVPPDRFIGAAEEIGLIGPLGAWVLGEACREAAAWPEPLDVAVNVSPLQFRHAGLCEAVEAALRESGLDPARLELEITESALLRHTQDILEALQRLRSLGVRIAMDDFGTGYSSLGYLNRFGFDKIKIDRSFVQRMAHDPRAKAVIRAMMGLSQTLGIRANAEGVESDEQAELLRQEGCEEVQGYLYGRPMPPAQFATLCRAAAAPLPLRGKLRS